MEIIAITVCVNYDDILTHMLQQNSKFLHRWFIVTSPDDTKTIQMIEKFGKENVQILLYNDFYKNEADFNKGGAILFAQNYVETNYSSANILILDGDIYLPSDFTDKLPKSIAEDTLYGAYRTDYWTLEDFTNETYSGQRNYQQFLGHFQLYKSNTKYKYEDSLNCSNCDNIFTNKFPKRQRLALRVKHLGQGGANWHGRNYDHGTF